MLKKIKKIIKDNMPEIKTYLISEELIQIKKNQAFINFSIFF